MASLAKLRHSRCWRTSGCTEGLLLITLCASGCQGTSWLPIWQPLWKRCPASLAQAQDACPIHPAVYYDPNQGACTSVLPAPASASSVALDRAEARLHCHNLRSSLNTQCVHTAMLPKKFSATTTMAAAQAGTHQEPHGARGECIDCSVQGLRDVGVAGALCCAGAHEGRLRAPSQALRQGGQCVDDRVDRLVRAHAPRTQVQRHCVLQLQLRGSTPLCPVHLTIM